MSYVTENTLWLSDHISADAKALIARFYELADSKQADAGLLMATEVFSSDAVMISPGGTYTGVSGTVLLIPHLRAAWASHRAEANSLFSFSRDNKKS
jgi:hypothetical protein